MISHFFTALSVLVSFVSIGLTFRANRRKRLFCRHMLACRQLQLDSVEAMKIGDLQHFDLLMAAAQGELEQAMRYS